MLGLPWHQCTIPLGKLFFFFLAQVLRKMSWKKRGWRLKMLIAVSWAPVCQLGASWATGGHVSGPAVCSVWV